MESQDAAADFFFRLWPWIEANKNKIVGGAAIIVLAVVVISFVSWRHTANQVEAGEAMTQALLSLPPNAAPAQVAASYLDVANTYAGSVAGGRALLQAAAVLFAEGKYTDAQMYFQRFADENPNSELFGQALLGVAKSLEAEGKDNDAAGKYQYIISNAADSESVIAAKFALAEIDMQENNFADAERLFQDVAQSDPYGALGQQARAYAFEMNSKAPVAPSTAPAPKAESAPASFNLSH